MQESFCRHDVVCVPEKRSRCLTDEEEDEVSE